MSSEKVQQYIDSVITSSGFIMIDKMLASGGSIEPYLSGQANGLTIGCEAVSEDEAARYAALIVKLINNNDNAVFVYSRRDAVYSECVAQGIEAKMLQTDDGEALYAYKVDFFICSSTLFNRFLQRHDKASILTNPFDFLPKPIRYNYIRSFDMRYPFTFDFLAKRENFDVKTPFDYVRLNYGSVLSEEDMVRHYNSESTGVDAYFEWMDLLIKNEPLRRRNRELAMLMLEWRATYDSTNRNDKLAETFMVLMGFEDAR